MRAGVRKVGLLAVVLAVIPIRAQSLPLQDQPPGCSAQALVTCRADRNIDRRGRTLGLDLEVTSPGAGLLPGAGTAKRSITLRGTYRLSKSAPRLELMADLMITEANASHTRPVPDPGEHLARGEVVPSGQGTAAAISARFKAIAPRCARACRAVDEDTIVTIGPCGTQQRSSHRIGLYLLITNRSGVLIPAGPIRYEITLVGHAALGSFPYLEPAQPDTGTVLARAEAQVEQVYGRAPKGHLLPMFKPTSCPPSFAGRAPRPNATVTAGSDVVVGQGFLVRNGRHSGEFVVAAHRAGAAVSNAGPFVPGWYEVSTGVGCSIVTRGSLGPEDMTVSDSGRVTLRVPLTGYGVATLVFTGGGPSQPFGGAGVATGCGIGSYTTTWQMDATFIDVERARLTGHVGRYSVTGIDPFDARGTQFAFRAAHGAIQTCTDCHSPV